MSDVKRFTKKPTPAPIKPAAPKEPVVKSKTVTTALPVVPEPIVTAPMNISADMLGLHKKAEPTISVAPAGLTHTTKTSTIKKPTLQITSAPELPEGTLDIVGEVPTIGKPNAPSTPLAKAQVKGIEKMEERGADLLAASEFIKREIAANPVVRQVDLDLRNNSGLGTAAKDVNDVADKMAARAMSREKLIRGMPSDGELPSDVSGKIKDDARTEAIRVVSAYKTLGWWSGPIVFDENKKIENPTFGDIAGAYLAPHKNVVGYKDGEAVVESENPAEYLLNTWNQGLIGPLVATGIPDVVAQSDIPFVGSGVKKGSKPATLPRSIEEAKKKAFESLSTRRTFNDVMNDAGTNYQVLNAVLPPDAAELVGAGQQMFIGQGSDVAATFAFDPFGVLISKGLKLAKGASNFVRVTTSVEREAKLASDALRSIEKESIIAKGIAEAEPTIVAAGSKPVMSRAIRAQEEAAKASEIAESYSPALKKELDNRTLAALGDEARASEDIQPLIARIANDMNNSGVVQNAVTVEGALKLARDSIAKDIESASAANASLDTIWIGERAVRDSDNLPALYEAIDRARSKAVTSLIEDLSKPASAVKTGKEQIGSYDVLARSLGIVKTDSKIARKLEAGIKNGKVELSPTASAAFKEQISKATGHVIPDTLVPKGIVTEKALSDVDKWVSSVEKITSSAASNAKRSQEILSKKITPATIRERFKVSPIKDAVGTSEHLKSLIVGAGESVASVATPIGSAIKAAVLGADETKPIIDAGFNKQIYKATSEAARVQETILGDVANLTSEDQMFAYLVGAKTGNDFQNSMTVTRGMNLFDLYRQSMHAGTISGSSLGNLARSFVPEGTMLTEAQSKRIVESLRAIRDDDTPATYIARLIETTGDALPDSSVALAIGSQGTHKATAIIATQGAALPIYEKNLGEGVVMSSDQYSSLVDYWTGGVINLSRKERKAALGESAGYSAGGTIDPESYRSLESARAASLQEIVPGAQFEKVKIKAPVDKQSEYAAKALSSESAKAAKTSDRAEFNLDKALQERADLLNKKTVNVVKYTKKAEAVERNIVAAEDAAMSADDLAKLRDAAAEKASSIAGSRTDAIAELHPNIVGAIGTDIYIPAPVREAMEKAINQALSKQDTPAFMKQMLTIFKRGVTRGINLLNVKHHYNNLWGDGEQIFVSHGAKVAARSQMENLLQEIMATPLFGQLEQISQRSLGNVPIQHDVLAVGEQVLPILAGQKKAPIFPELFEKIRSAATKKLPILDDILGTGQSFVEVNTLLDGAPSHIRIGGKSYFVPDLKKAMIEGGVLDGQDVGELAGAVKLTTETNGVSRAIDILGGDNFVAKSSQEIAEQISQRRRVGLFRILLESGATPEEAAKGVVTALYDYRHSMTDFERNNVGWVIPFWSWQKNNNRQVFGAMASPSGAARMRAYHMGIGYAADDISKGIEAYQNRDTGGSDADEYGALISQMKKEDEQLYGKYNLAIKLLKDAGITDPSEIQWELTDIDRRSALRQAASSHDVGFTEEDINEWAKYMAGFGNIIPLSERPVSQYNSSKTAIRVKSKVGSDSSTWADFMLFYLPESGTVSALNWAGAAVATTLGIASVAREAVGGPQATAQGPGTIVNDLIRPDRVAMLNVVISQMPFTTTKAPTSKVASERLGRQLAKYDMVEKKAGGYYITNPAMYSIWNYSAPGKSFSELDKALALFEEGLKNDKDPNSDEMKSFARFINNWFGVASESVHPDSVITNRMYSTKDNVNVLKKTGSKIEYDSSSGEAAPESAVMEK